MENQKQPTAILKTILWFALFASNFAFLAITFTVPAAGPIPEAPGALPIGYMFFAIGCMMVALSFIVPKFLKPTPQVKDVEMTKFILGLALNESASLFAFIMGFVFQETKMSYALFAFSIVGYLLKFPKKDLAVEDKSKSNSLNAE